NGVEVAPVLGTSVATGTIIDNDSATISIADTSVTEGGNLVFTLSRSTTSDANQTVDYTVALGTAEATDISGATVGTVTFAPGALTQTVTVGTVNDTIDEVNETVTVTLSNPNGVEVAPVLGTSVATGTIIDDDSATISIADTSVTEGGNLVFTLSRSTTSDANQTVDYTVALGTAEATDISGATVGTVTFAPGALTQTVTVGTVNDTIDEVNETVTVTLSNPNGVEVAPVLGTSVATGTIIDNDSATISIADTSVTEGGNLVFTLSRSTTSDANQTVDYTVALGTAEATDISGATVGTVTFAPGALTQTVTVGTVNDTIDEVNETVTVTLSNPNGVEVAPVLGTSVATGTIIDNDSATISIADTSVTEGGNLVFTLSRSTTSDANQTVDYTVALGTAEATDISGATVGTVTFAPGALTQTVTVGTVNDTIDEVNETVTVTLSNPNGVEVAPVLGTSVATGTIIDDDSATISIADTSVTEGGNLVFTLTRSSTSDANQTVDYTVALGTAEATDISGALSGTVTFAPGQTSQTVTVATVGDAIDEGDETVTVTLSNPQG